MNIYRSSDRYTFESVTKDILKWLIWTFVYVLTAQTSAGPVGPKFKIDSQIQMAAFHFSITYKNGSYL